jgi:hypothetical protein
MERHRMAETTMKLTPEQHEQCAKALFNSVWTLLESDDRTEDEDDLMIHRVHAMMVHWLQVGEPVNLARGEWQLSRVYATLCRPDPAVHHARRCRAICDADGLGDFDRGFAFEALARAHAVAGNESEMTTYLHLAETAAGAVDDEADRKILVDDLQTIRLSPDKN